MSSEELLDKCERRLIKWRNVEEAFKNSHVYRLPSFQRYGFLLILV